MSKELLEAYHKLIPELQLWRKGQEWGAIQTFGKWINSDFIQLLEEVIEDVAHKGKISRVNYLIPYANEVAEILRITFLNLPFSLLTNSNSRLTLLMQFLQKYLKEEDNTRQVYPLLRANLDKLDNNFAEVLKSWATAALLMGSTKKISTLCNLPGIARNIISLSHLMQNFPYGNQASNLEISIAGYFAALKVFTREVFPETWAQTQNNLGVVYRKRIKDKSAENLEKAIQFYKAALEVYTHQAFPQDWAMVSYNLGNAYMTRIHGKKQENLEKAIGFYSFALEVYTRQAFPQDWADTQNYLGDSYFYLIQGNFTENKKRAINCYRAALGIYTRPTFFQKWTEIHNKLCICLLVRVFKAIKNSNNNSQQELYPLLEQNLDLIDDNFPKVLRDWSTNWLSAIELQQAQELALKIVIFSNLVKNFQSGQQLHRLKIANSGYAIAATVFDRKTFPERWKYIQNQIQECFAIEILLISIHRSGKPQEVYSLLEENLDKLNRDFSKVLQGCAIATLSAVEAEQAEIIARGIFAFSGLIFNFPLGERAINIEIAVTGYKIASTVFTREAFPQEWASIQGDLSGVYSHWVGRNRINYLEKAIAAGQSALQVLTRESFPKQWAGAHLNLSRAYCYRIYGDSAQNKEMAILSCRSALEIFTREAYPEEWALIQNNLGNNYIYRIQGKRADNIEQAISALRSALQIWTHEKFPEKWAYAQDNLGLAFGNQTRGIQTENLEQAIRHFKAALQVRTREEFPQAWANTQINLGHAYRAQTCGVETENLEQAIRCYQAALEVYTYESNPRDWAATQNDIGDIYSIRSVETENLEQAIRCYQAALEVYNLEVDPNRYAETKASLGRVYLDTHQFGNAYTTIASAIETIEFLREEIISGAESKRKHAMKWNHTYRRMVEVCLKLGNVTEAIEYVERSKTRNLIEQIFNRELKTIFPSEVVTQLEKYRDRIAAHQYQIQHGKVKNLTTLAQNLQMLRQQRNELQDRYFSIGYSFQFERFQNKLDDRTAVLEFYIARDKLIVFIFTHEIKQPIVKQFQLNDLQKLVDWANEYLIGYNTDKSDWQNNLNNRLHLLAEISHLDELVQNIPPKCNKLILIPHLYLHLFPLHALPVADTKSETSILRLLDVFPDGVSYAPSCQLLQLAQTRKRLEFNQLFAVQNPTDNLNYSNLEVEVIKSYFQSAEVLRSQNASEAAVKANQKFTTAHCNHFSCHGYFNFKSPQKSALMLAEAKKEYSNQDKAIENGFLTLKEIFNFNLNQCRLVILSACETGLIDFTNISDEYIGLPSSFLIAGSPAVVSSLWKVEDFSTAFLMIKFYQNLFKPMSLAPALNQAQKWLRNLTIDEFDLLLEQYMPQLDRVLEQLRPGQRIIHEEHIKLIHQRKPYPFAEPYYWAAFTAIGI